MNRLAQPTRFQAPFRRASKTKNSRTDIGKSLLLLLPVFMLLMWQCTSTEHPRVNSPDGSIQAQFIMNESGVPGYRILHKGSPVIDTSHLGFELKNAPGLHSGWKITQTTRKSVNNTWQMLWGEQRNVANHYNQLNIKLKEKNAPNRKMNVIFRVYDDGIGFRYVFPGQKNMDEVVIMGEKSQFNLTGNHTCWWIPGDWDIYEHLYNKTPFTGIDATTKRNNDNLAQTYIPYNAVNTPVTMKTQKGLHLSFHEADLTDYAGMTLRVNKDQLMMESELVGSDRLGYKVKRKAPFATPWRTIQISEDAAGLIESNLIVNLNDPNQLGEMPWFTPMKYVGIWWEMHVGKSTWAMEGGKHGATTEHAKEMINFAAANNIGGVLVEGWNTGWEHWIGFDDREGVFDFVTPYPDYDLQEVARYAKENGVELIMHHETSAAPRTYEKQLDTAYKLMERLGLHSVKTGYVGEIIPEGEYHHGQWMVNHYRKVLKTAAEHQVAVNAHEPIKATGIRRTWPNAITREGLRGQEFNAWASDGGNPPDHLPTVAFTRMLAGPIDYTPGIFNIQPMGDADKNRISTTLAQQLALYVVINSPLQMAADLRENYKDHPAFQFIRDVAVNWEQSLVLNGKIGQYVTMARQERGTQNWFVGSITNEEPREMNISLDFLEPGQKYTAALYRDGDNAHWKDNPTAYAIDTLKVTSESTLDLRLAPGGGAAVSIMGPTD